ncbi:MAG: 5-formyltetrahydrofolate cyclo-ligase [Oleibacter sp.]|nr:5-formyltetrahydrofolate cyclo-ligase [Thalassolituus sp.]
MTSFQSRNTLRQTLRRQRRALSTKQRRIAATGLQRQLNRQPATLFAHSIALYLTNDGEIDTALFLKRAIQRKQRIYLPVLHPCYRGRLAFIRYQPHTTPMTINRFGIKEPDFALNKRVSARFISVICLPLVAFDKTGNRLGMGGGFYDRTLAFMAGSGQKPKVIGCAYEFQRVAKIPTESWDIPLDYIATDAQVYRC